MSGVPLHCVHVNDVFVFKPGSSLTVASPLSPSLGPPRNSRHGRGAPGLSVALQSPRHIPQPKTNFETKEKFDPMSNLMA